MNLQKEGGKAMSKKLVGMLAMIRLSNFVTGNNGGEGYV